MEANEKPGQTDLNSIVSANQIQIMKAALPYIPFSEQKFISAYIKFKELMNTLNLFNPPGKGIVGICSANEKPGNQNMLTLLLCLHGTKARKEV